MHFDFTITAVDVRHLAAIGIACGLIGTALFATCIATRSRGAFLTLAIVLLFAGVIGQAITLTLLVSGRFL